MIDAECQADIKLDAELEDAQKEREDKISKAVEKNKATGSRAPINLGASLTASTSGGGSNAREEEDSPSGKLLPKSKQSTEKKQPLARSIKRDIPDFMKPIG